jgi:hypothetical protein
MLFVVGEKRNLIIKFFTMIMKKDGMAVWIARNFPHKHKKSHESEIFILLF